MVEGVGGSERRGSHNRAPYGWGGARVVEGVEGGSERRG